MKIINIKAAHSLLAGLVLSSVSVIVQAEAPAFTLKVDTVNLAADSTRNATTSSQSTRLHGPRTSHSNSRSVRLRDGGVIWVSKDPSSLTPTLNVSAPATVGMENGRFANPMSFTVNTNYASFINSWEIDVFSC